MAWCVLEQALDEQGLPEGHPYPIGSPHVDRASAAKMAKDLNEVEERSSHRTANFIVGELSDREFGKIPVLR